MARRSAELRRLAKGVVSVNTDERTTSPPGHPMRVAREFLATSTRPRGPDTLRSHRGMFYRWAVTHWSEVDARAFVPAFTAGLRKPVLGPQKEPATLAPWQPTKMKIANVIEAVHAGRAHGRGRNPPCWMFDSNNQVDP